MPEPSPKDALANYITPSGVQRLRDELRFLLTRERPAVTKVVAWAAGNGDRSENADYQYGKRRLRQIDGRIRFLTKRIDAARVVDPEAPRTGRAATLVFFGATVRYVNATGTERMVSIVGVDEVDLDRHHISWLSPLARALMKSGPGDRVTLHAPAGIEDLQILEVRYERISVNALHASQLAPRRRPRLLLVPCVEIQVERRLLRRRAAGSMASSGVQMDRSCVRPKNAVRYHLFPIWQRLDCL